MQNCLKNYFGLDVNRSTQHKDIFTSNDKTRCKFAEFFHHFVQGDSICDFLFAYKKGSTPIGKNLLTNSFLYELTPLEKGLKMKMEWLLPLDVHQVTVRQV